MLMIMAMTAGSRTPEDTYSMLQELIMRVDSGDPEALYRLSTIYEQGFDTIPRDSIRALSLLRESAEKGWLPAQNYLGYTLIRKGQGEEGLQWLEQAAISGDPKAQNNLGFLLLENEENTLAGEAGIATDNEKAAFWLERASQAGSATASSMLGDLYRYGKGVTRDSVMAAAHYYAAIDAGLADAAYKLENMEREHWRTLSPRKQLEIALYLYTHRAPELAIPIFKRIAEESMETGADDDINPDIRASLSGDALALLGDAYSRGLGVGYDYDKSLDYYFRAAMLGNAPAQFILSELLEIFPDILERYTDLPISARELRDSAAFAGITDAAEANRRLLSPLPPISSN